MATKVLFEDVDGDGEREVAMENSWLRAVLRFPEKLGYAFYKGRFTWGGRLQSLVYKPTGRERLLPRMIDQEGINPFGLPDELFATFPFTASGGEQRNLKMGVGVFAADGGEAGCLDRGECAVGVRRERVADGPELQRDGRTGHRISPAAESPPVRV